MEESDAITSSTNWIVADGCVGDSVSFETSADESETAVPKDLLLLKPAMPPDSDDPSPCEVTINFSRKHEIHRVYVRSTARIFEVYYATDNQDTSKEYLCTVRCGEVVKEVVSSHISEVANGCQEAINGTVASQEQVGRSDISSSDEEGWVQIKVPHSTHQENAKNPRLEKTDGENDSQTVHTHYEATAEISDSVPCVSLTLRLLSIQTKSCVHVEEIYIYADAVESIDPDSPKTIAETSGGSSLLAMMLPSLLQLSKSRASEIQENGRSDQQKSPNYQCDKETTNSLDLHYMRAQEVSSFTSPDPKLGSVQEASEVDSEKTKVETGQKVPELNKKSNSCTDQHVYMGYDRLENLLGELISRVGKVEAFCSRFEENMMKPISCMDMRLQQVEYKLDALVARSQYSEQFHHSTVPDEQSGSVSTLSNSYCKEAKEDAIADTAVLPADGMSTPKLETCPGLKIKAPDFSADGMSYYPVSRLSNNECGEIIVDTIADTEALLADGMPSSKLDTCPGLIIEAPEFSADDMSDSVSRLSSSVCKEVNEDTIADAAALAADGMSKPKLEKRPGLIIKAPDFSVEDDESFDSNTVCNSVKEHVTKNKVVSIDSLLASSLEAFLTKNTSDPSTRRSSSEEIPQACFEVTSRTLTTSNGVVSDDKECSISDAKGKEMCCGEPELVLDDAAVPGDKFNISDMKGEGCESFEFKDASHLAEMNWIMNQASMSTVVQSVSQSSTTVQCSKLLHESDMKRAYKEDEASDAKDEMYLDCGRNNDLPYEVCSEVNKQNDTTVEVYLDQTQNILPGEACYELKEQDGLKCRYNNLDVDACYRSSASYCQTHEGDSKHDSDATQNLSVDSSTSGSSQDLTCRSLQGVSSNENDSVAVRQARKTISTTVSNCISCLDEEYLSDGGSTKSPRDVTIFASSNKNDYKAPVLMSSLPSNWIDDYSFKSIVEDHFLKHKFDMLQSAECMNSSGKDCVTNMAVENKTTNHNTDHLATNSCQSCETCSQDQFNAELGQDISTSMLDFDSLGSLKFNTENNWATGISLEVLLAGTLDTKVSEAAAVRREDNRDNSGEKQHNSSSSEDADSDCDADADGLLNKSEDPDLLTEEEINALNDLPLFTDFKDLNNLCLFNDIGELL